MNRKHKHNILLVELQNYDVKEQMPASEEKKYLLQQ